MCKKIASIAFIILTLLSCSNFQKEANKRAVEKLNNQFKQENYDEMYHQSSSILQHSITKDEFISIVKEIRKKMSEVDENLTWQESDKLHFDESVFRDDNFSYRIMSKTGRELHIEISWNTPFQLCGLSIYENPNESSGIGFRYCD